MHKRLFYIALACIVATLGVGQAVYAQRTLTDIDQNRDPFANDTVQKEDVPEGIDYWQVDERFGNILHTLPDTAMTLFQNNAFTSGRTGHYNYLGNLGSPRHSRVWFDNSVSDMFGNFLFAAPYDFFLRQPSELWWTNTKSPFTNLTYHECGNKQYGEDRLTALFATNVNKRLGFGFDADYLYGRGYYASQSTSQITGRFFASYIGQRYDLHASVSTHYLKTAENGGLEDDTYITNPEAFSSSYSEADMPMRLSKTWNRQHLFTVFLSHRYRLGFSRYRDTRGRIVHQSQIAAGGTPAGGMLARLTMMPDDSLAVDTLGVRSQPTDTLPALTLEQRLRSDAPDSLRLVSEFVPVASIVHTLRVDAHRRQFLSNLPMNADDTSYFLDFYLPGDSTSDKTNYTRVRNMLSLEINEGFSRWMKAGIRFYAAHEFERYTLPRLDLSTEHYTSHYITVGARLVSTHNRFLHYDAFAETRTDGSSWGEFLAHAQAEGNIPFLADTLHIGVNGTLRSEHPDFYYEHYHARNAWWDHDDYDKFFISRLGGTLRWRDTRLSVGVEAIQNYTYFAETRQATDVDNLYLYGVAAHQASKNIQVISGTLAQDLALGIFRWSGELTAQVSSDKDILPLPALNAYTNLYIDFRIARVLHTQIGVDLRWFTKYYAPTYSPIIGQYAVQDTDTRVKIGGYPMVNAYANFHLKRTRFYIMASHLNYSSGVGRPFLVPHHPLNRLVLRFGVSWNFIN